MLSGLSDFLSVSDFSPKCPRRIVSCTSARLQIVRPVAKGSGARSVRATYGYGSLRQDVYVNICSTRLHPVMHSVGGRHQPNESPPPNLCQLAHKTLPADFLRSLSDWVAERKTSLS